MGITAFAFTIKAAKRSDALLDSLPRSVLSFDTMDCAYCGLVAGKTWRRAARHCADNRMIQNDNELKATQERIGYFQNLLAQFRVTARPEEFPLVSGGYSAEIEKMQKEALDYLTRFAGETARAV